MYTNGFLTELFCQGALQPVTPPATPVKITESSCVNVNPPKKMSTIMCTQALRQSQFMSVAIYLQCTSFRDEAL